VQGDRRARRQGLLCALLLALLRVGEDEGHDSGRGEPRPYFILESLVAVVSDLRAGSGGLVFWQIGEAGGPCLLR
jgi:hypothetical protein